MFRLLAFLLFVVSVDAISTPFPTTDVKHTYGDLPDVSSSTTTSATTPTTVSRRRIPHPRNIIPPTEKPGTPVGVAVIYGICGAILIGMLAIAIIACVLKHTKYAQKTPLQHNIVYNPSHTLQRPYNVESGKSTVNVKISSIPYAHPVTDDAFQIDSNNVHEESF